MTRGERAADAAATLFQWAEDPEFGWIATAGGVLAAGACWYLAITHHEWLHAMLTPGSSAGTPVPVTRLERAVLWLGTVGTVAGPAVAVYAMAYRLWPAPPADDSVPADPFDKFMVENPMARQRRVLLASALAAVLNAMALLIWAF